MAVEARQLLANFRLRKSLGLLPGASTSASLPAERRAALRCDGRRMIKSGRVPAAPPPTTSARRRAEASTHRSFLGKYGLDAVDGDVVVKR